MSPRRPLSRSPSLAHSARHSVKEEREEDFETADEGPVGGMGALNGGDVLPRSSVDSIAAEVQHTLRSTPTRPLSQGRPELHHAHSFPRRPLSVLSDGLRSVASEHLPAPSIFSSSSASRMPVRTSFDLNLNLGTIPPRADNPIVTYLRSTRVTTLLQLTREPHASVEYPLTVSLCDLGAQNGHPLVVFLGLGCVRHVMGVYDEMAELLGLRIIAVDR
jgi:hypothetical protein